MPTYRRFRGAIMPMVFIVSGILLLLNTLDLIDWYFWTQLARLWPIVVIGFGVHLLWRHFRRA